MSTFDVDTFDIPLIGRRVADDSYNPSDGLFIKHIEGSDLWLHAKSENSTISKARKTLKNVIEANGIERVIFMNSCVDLKELSGIDFRLKIEGPQFTFDGNYQRLNVRTATINIKDGSLLKSCRMNCDFMHIGSLDYPLTQLKLPLEKGRLKVNGVFNVYFKASLVKKFQGDISVKDLLELRNINFKSVNLHFVNNRDLIYEATIYKEPHNGAKETKDGYYLRIDKTCAF